VVYGSSASYYLLVGTRNLVFCSGLNGSFEQKPFGKILDLVPQADEVVHLKAKCTTCLFDGTIKDAPFTKRLIEDRTLNIPGGKETYAAVCRNIYPSGPRYPVSVENPLVVKR